MQLWHLSLWVCREVQLIVELSVYRRILAGEGCCLQSCQQATTQQCGTTSSGSFQGLATQICTQCTVWTFITSGAFKWCWGLCLPSQPTCLVGMRSVTRAVDANLQTHTDPYALYQLGMALVLEAVAALLPTCLLVATPMLHNSGCLACCKNWQHL